MLGLIIIFLIQTLAGHFLMEDLKLVWGEIFPKESKPFTKKRFGNLVRKKIKKKKLTKREQRYFEELAKLLDSNKKEFTALFKKEFRKWRATIKEDREKVLEELDTAVARLGILPDEIKTIVEKALLRSAFYLFVDTQKFLKSKDDELQATRVYVPRADEITELQKFLESQNRLLLISGDRGVGKTRLLVEYARLLEDKRTPCYFTSPVIETDAKKYEYELNQLAKGKELFLLVDEIDKLPDQFLDLFGPYSRVEGKDGIRVIGCTYYPDKVHVSPFEPAIQPYHLKVFEDVSKLKEVAIENFTELAGSKDLDELVRHLNGYPDAVIAFFFMLQKGEIKWGELASRDIILEKRFKEQYEEVKEHVQALATLAAIQMVGDNELENFDRFYQKYHNVSFEAALRSEYVRPHVGYVEDPGVRFFRSRELLGLYMVRRFFFDEDGAGDIKALAEVEARNLSAPFFVERLLSLREVFERDNNERCLAKCDRAIAALLEEIQIPGSHTKALFRVIDILDERYARRGILRDKVNWECLKERLRELPEQKDRAMWLHNMGVVLGHLGKPLEAKSWYGESLEIAKELDDKSGIAMSLGQLGNIAQAQGDYEEARNRHEEAKKVFEELGEKAYVAVALHQLGMTAQDQGDYAEARSKYEEAKEAFEELGEKGHVAAVLHNLGAIAQQQGDYAEARRLYGESLEIKKGLGDKSGIASTLHQLGMIAQQQGDYAEARRPYGESLEIEKELGDKSGIAKTLHQLGNIAYLQGDYVEARRLYGDSLEIEKELGDKSGIAYSLGQLGNLALGQGDYTEAKSCYKEVLDMSKKLGDKSSIANSLHQLGMIAHDQGDYDEARKLYEESLELAKELGDKSGIALSLGQLGRLAEEEGNELEAFTCYLQALNIFTQLKAPKAQLAASDITRLRERVGQEEFERLVKKAGEKLGQDLSPILKWFEGE